MWIDEREAVCDLLDLIEFAPTQRLDTAVLDRSPAVYVWTYIGDRRGEGPHLDLYYDWLTKTGWPAYVGSATTMSARRRRHLRNFDEVRDVSADELLVAVLPMPSHAMALFAEGLLIDMYQPVWNVALPGVGSSDQGRSRRTQRPSPFAVVHGRERCGQGHPAIVAALSFHRGFVIPAQAGIQ